MSFATPTSTVPTGTGPTDRIAPRHRPVPVIEAAWPVTASPARPLDESLVRDARELGKRLPANVRTALSAMADDDRGIGAVLIRGVDVGPLPATPADPTERTSKDSRSELALLAVASLLGEPVGYLPEHGGDVVQNISPTRAQASRQTSTSSAVNLAFHTETAFHPFRPRFLVLLCLKGDADAATTLCCVDDLLPGLSPTSRAVLAEPRFRTRADESFGGGTTAPLGAPISVLSGDPEHPTLIFDAELTTGTDPAAQRALDEFAALVAEHHTSVVLTPGDLLVVDNHRCVHGRSQFAARFDGTDRWLQRAFVVDDLAPSTAERSGRIITTRFDV